MKKLYIILIKYKLFCNIFLSFHCCYELAGWGRLVLVGLLEGVGLSLVLFFEQLVAGDDFFQGVGSALGIF